jgi:hypothetical protein
MKRIFTLLMLIGCIAISIQAQRKGPAPIFPNGSRSMILVQDLDSGPSANDLVEAILPTGTPYSNVVTSSHNGGLGAFSGGTAASFGLDQGIVLGSGCVNDLVTGGCGWSTIAGDIDLNNLGGGYSTCDASILEFDFVPQASPLNLSFIFATNDYLPFGDPCAIFLDGVNIATMNEGQEVSNRTIYNTSCFFVNQGSVEVNVTGISPVFHATAVVSTGESHHLKIAVADDLDCMVNTYIFASPGLIGEGQCCCRTTFPTPLSNWVLVIAFMAILGTVIMRFRFINR